MLGRLPPTTVFGKVLTLLEGPGLLQERFLGMLPCGLCPLQRPPRNPAESPSVLVQRPRCGQY